MRIGVQIRGAASVAPPEPLTDPDEDALAEVVALAAAPLDGELTPEDFRRYGQGPGDKPGWKQ